MPVQCLRYGIVPKSSVPYRYLSSTEPVLVELHISIVVIAQFGCKAAPKDLQNCRVTASNCESVKGGVM
jgi:hypothetical protein